jgi:hypothetical protein
MVPEMVWPVAGVLKATVGGVISGAGVVLAEPVVVPAVGESVTAGPVIAPPAAESVVAVPEDEAARVLVMPIEALAIPAGIVRFTNAIVPFEIGFSFRPQSKHL